MLFTVTKSWPRCHRLFTILTIGCYGFLDGTDGFQQNRLSSIIRTTPRQGYKTKTTLCHSDDIGVTAITNLASLFSLDPRHGSGSASDDRMVEERTSTIAVVGRRHLLQSSLAAVATVTGLSLVRDNVPVASAAPPIFVIAEELGYFPVQNRNGDVSYIPRSVRRHSSEQAIALAQHLRKAGVVMYGAYWCPHCARQRELFGREAWSYILYQECGDKGYQGNVKLCKSQQDIVTGYPTWTTAASSSSSSRRKRESPPPIVLAGEQSLGELAKTFQYPGTWNDELEVNVPPPLSGGCKI